MGVPELLRQPNWVLQSASMDQPGPAQLSPEPNADALAAWALIEPGWQAFERGDRASGEQLWREALRRAPHNLLLQRAVNTQAPALLPRVRLRGLRAPWGSRVAIVLPGELRNLERNLPLLRALARQADLFTCTSAAFAAAAQALPGQRLIVDPEPLLPMGAMQQWHKLAECLRLVRAHEQQTGRRYSHILKLRTDYQYVAPRRLLHDLVRADGLICASDKVFGGQRDLMLLFEGFQAAIAGWFDNQEQRYWPINTAQILESDDSAKWYGMGFPAELVGQPATVEELRSILRSGGSALAEALRRWTPSSPDDPQLHRLFRGHPRFASEVCFARFLNFNGIPAHHCRSLQGFLQRDRLG